MPVYRVKPQRGSRIPWKPLLRCHTRNSHYLMPTSQPLPPLPIFSQRLYSPVCTPGNEQNYELAMREPAPLRGAGTTHAPGLWLRSCAWHPCANWSGTPENPAGSAPMLAKKTTGELAHDTCARPRSRQERNLVRGAGAAQPTASAARARALTSATRRNSDPPGRAPL